MCNDNSLSESPHSTSEYKHTSVLSSWNQDLIYRGDRARLNQLRVAVFSITSHPRLEPYSKILNWNEIDSTILNNNHILIR